MNSDKSCRVYVGNLAWTVDEQNLESHMKAAGTVLKAQIFKYHDGYSKGCGIVTYSNSADAQKAIKNLSDTKISDRLIFVREDREANESESYRGSRYNRGPNRRYNKSFRAPKSNFEQHDREIPGRFQSRGGNRRFPRYYGGKPVAREGDIIVDISNLSSRTTWKDLKDFFKQAGQVTRADVLPSMDGERTGVVHFSNMKDAMNAVSSLNEKELQGSKLTVTLHESESKEEEN